MAPLMDARPSSICGADLSDVELAEWLAPVKRPVVVINCASASGPFLNRLSGNDRVVVTATKSGHETNFARFGQYLAEAIADPHADLDKDGQVSLLEAFLTAQQPGRGVLSHPFATGHRARASGRQRRPAGHASDLVSRRSCDPARQGRCQARRHAGPPVAPDRQHARAWPFPPKSVAGAISSNYRSPPCGIKKRSSPRTTITAELETLMVELARIYREMPAAPTNGGEHAATHALYRGTSSRATGSGGPHVNQLCTSSPQSRVLRPEPPQKSRDNAHEQRHSQRAGDDNRWVARLLDKRAIGFQAGHDDQLDDDRMQEISEQRVGACGPKQDRPPLETGDIDHLVKSNP